MTRKPLRSPPINTTGDVLNLLDEESRAMDHEGSSCTDRRTSLRAGALATAAAPATGPGPAA